MKPKTKKIDILGTTYDFVIADKNSHPRLAELDVDGYCDSSVKRIVINDDVRGTLEDTTEYKKAIRRHEIMHAMLFECGLDVESNNERMIDWWAFQFPKLIKIFEQAEAL